MMARRDGIAGWVAVLLVAFGSAPAHAQEPPPAPPMPAPVDPPAVAPPAAADATARPARPRRRARPVAPPTAALGLEPWSSHDGVDRPYRYIVSLRSTTGGPVEVVADRRLLELEVQVVEGRRTRRHRCRHPASPRRVSEGRVRTIAPALADPEWREWIDLRMYCWGRARSALDAGAEVRVRYGFPRASARRWVARAPGAPPIGALEAPSFVFPARADAAVTQQAGSEDAAAPVHLELAPASARTEGALVFRTSLRASVGSRRVYERPDAWTFQVQGPLGAVECGLEPGGGSPPPDLFRRITPRARVREVLDAEYFCPAGTFELEGIYEIVPKLHLEHSGAEYELRAVTGRFVGPPAVARITVGERGYVEQIPSGTPTVSVN